MNLTTMNNRFRLLFATQNNGKYDEVNKMMPSNVNLLSLNDLNFKEHIKETRFIIKNIIKP